MNYKRLKCVPKFTQDHIAFMKSIGFTPFRERDGKIFAFTKVINGELSIEIRSDCGIDVSGVVDFDPKFCITTYLFDLSEVFGIIQLLLENGIVSCTDSCIY